MAVALVWGWFAPVSTWACLECHSDKELTTSSDSGAASLWVDAEALAASTHEDLACEDCHSDVDEYPHQEDLAPVDCSACHDSAAEDYATSIHGLRLAGGDIDAPGCAACHGKHDIRRVDAPQSQVSPLNLARTCTGCHTDGTVVGRHDHMPSVETITAYAGSVHGKGLFQRGLSVSATCRDCHGSHTVEPADDPRSSVYRSNIPNLCARCHNDIAREFKQSVHGQAADSGVAEAPVCTDCHGEHTIADASDPASSVSPANIPKTCAACHEEERIAGKFKMPGSRYSTYLDSYHGVVNKYGDKAVANCASCHGVHDIRPSSDPASKIHPGNLGRTCGTCHPGAEEGLADARIHVTVSPDSAAGVYYVRMFYYYLTGGLMLCFVLYMSIDIYGAIRRRKRGR